MVGDSRSMRDKRPSYPLQKALGNRLVMSLLKEYRYCGRWDRAHPTPASGKAQGSSSAAL